MLWVPYKKAYPSERHAVVGDVRVHRSLGSHGLRSRELIVYLPPSYESEPERRYPVLYMHDGQNVFDNATSYSGEWGADETAEWLAKEGVEAIIVAVPNASEMRLDEYGPWAELHFAPHGMTPPLGGRANDYLGFLLETVKPVVDGSFRTLPDAPNTGIVGSSMGGLVSLWATLERPDYFGFCGAMSPSFWFARGRIFRFARRQLAAINAGSVNRPRIYLDVGGREGGFARSARAYANAVHRMAELLEEGGLDVTCIEDPSAGHNEAAWRDRFPYVLRWFVDPDAEP